MNTVKKRRARKMSVAERVANNVKRIRSKKSLSVEDASKQSFRKCTEGISVPRWYRLEQGRHPGMLGEVLGLVSVLLDVDPAVLVMHPEDSLAAMSTSPSKPSPHKKRRPPPNGSAKKKSVKKRKANAKRARQSARSS